MESREGEAMVEMPSTTPWGRAMEMEPKEVETQAEPQSWRDQVTQRIWVPGDSSDGGAREDRGGVGGKEDPNRSVEVEGRGAA